MKLYYSPGACSLAVHIVLEESKIPYTLEKVNREAKTSEHIAANPMANVPTILLENGQGLGEGVAILQYLADQKPEANLAAKNGTWERAKLQETLNFLSTEVHKGFSPLFAQKAYEFDDATAKRFVDRTTMMLGKRFEVLENRLGKTPYLMGNTPTIADFYLFTILRWTKSTNVSLDQYPKLTDFQARIYTRPSVQAAMKQEGLI